MTEITHEALEALSKKAMQAWHAYKFEWKASALSAFLKVEDEYECALKALHRTGQLIHAQPSGDAVEAVKAAMLACKFSDGSHLIAKQGHCSPEMIANVLATAAITTYEAVSGVAKMREAVIGMQKHADIFDGGKHQANRLAFDEFARAALGEKP